MILYNLPTEQTILAQYIYDYKSTCEILGELDPKNFAAPQLQKTVKAILDLASKKQDINILSVSNNTNYSPSELDEWGTFARLMHTSQIIDTYKYLIKIKTIRELEEHGKSVNRDAKNLNPEEINQYIETLQTNLETMQLQSDNSPKIEVGMDLVNRNLKEYFSFLGEGKEINDHVTSPWRDFNNLFNGFYYSDLTIVAARPGMGKTAFIVNLIKHIALIEDKSCLLFSLEMTNDQLTKRLFSNIASINTKEWRNKKLDEKKVEANISKIINVFSKESKNRPGVKVCDNYALCDSVTTLSEILLETKKHIAKYSKLEVLFIDYLGLIHSDKKHQNREREVSYFTSELKKIAKQYNLTVILLSQLNRSLENRPDKRPKPADLRDSGSIEQDADNIYFLYRDEVYNKNSTSKNELEVICAKNRHGETGTITLGTELQFCRFNDIPVELLPQGDDEN